jgi:hypothetical protein
MPKARFLLAGVVSLCALALLMAAIQPPQPAWGQREASLQHRQRNPGNDDLVYPPCREVRSLDAMQYWFWDAYFGHVDVHDFTHERWGRLGADPTVCFRIALVVVDDPQMRTAGYRQAVSELLQWVPENRDELDDNARRALRQLERITGEDFEVRSEWVDWWQQSEPFVTWSAEDERLVVVAEAQAAGEAVHEDALLLEPEEYWFYDGRGWISQKEAVGDVMFGAVLIPPHAFNFRIPIYELQDRNAKERGYRRALGNLFVDGLLLDELSDDRYERIVGRLTQLTGEARPDRDAWVTWWQENRDRLALAPAGDRLIVRQ